MALFEQSPSRNGSRFGKLSSNMFFTRNTAKPKRVKHIEGIRIRSNSFENYFPFRQVSTAH